MEIKLYSPIILDMEAVMKQKPFSKGIRLKKDHLLFIVHCIMQQRASKDDEHLRKIGKRDGFVPLSSKILESKIPKYRDCVEYLVDAGIIECDEKYFPGKVSKGYRLTSPFTGNKFKEIKISDFALCRKIVKDTPFNKKNKAVNQFPYLAKWFETGKLQIDKKSALKWVDDFQALELQNIKTNKALKSKTRLEEEQFLSEKCNIYKILVNRLVEKDYFFHVDETGNRLHTNLTNLPKGLRQFLKYDSQGLVSIDIKNSQPYMSLPLLDKEFWQSKRLSDKPTLKELYEEYYQIVRSNSKRNQNIIMFQDSSKNLTSIDFQKQQFFKRVVVGDFYEYLVKILENEGQNLGNTDSEKRRKVKKMILTVLFDDNNKAYNKKSDSPSQIFKRLFPTVANIFEFTKKDNYRNLAIILQRIESHLLLKRICSRIAVENPTVAIFTIHDNIITTRGNEDYVQTVMREELGKSIGTPPQFSTEYW